MWPPSQPQACLGALFACISCLSYAICSAGRLPASWLPAALMLSGGGELAVSGTDGCNSPHRLPVPQDGLAPWRCSVPPDLAPVQAHLRDITNGHVSHATQGACL